MDPKHQTLSRLLLHFETDVLLYLLLRMPTGLSFVRFLSIDLHLEEVSHKKIDDPLHRE